MKKRQNLRKLIIRKQFSFFQVAVINFGIILAVFISTLIIKISETYASPPEYVLSMPQLELEFEDEPVYFPHKEYLFVENIIDFSKISRIGLNEREQAVFDFLANKYVKKYNLPDYIPYLFAAIESDFTINAFNLKTSATGLFQITPICLEEYNRNHQIKYTLLDLYEIEKNFEVSMWYINRLITLYKIPYSEDDVYALYVAYNMGPGGFANINKTGIPSTIQNRYNKQAEQVNLAYIYEE